MENTENVANRTIWYISDYNTSASTLILHVLRNEVMCSIPFVSFGHNDAYNIHTQFLVDLINHLKI